MKSSFQLDQTIAIIAGDEYYDIHNCFEFVGFEYRPTEKTARLEWRRSAGNWASADLPVRLYLTFDDVWNFAVQQRDNEMPFTEDNCVASISFLPPELSDNFTAICPNLRMDTEHLSIVFQSGAGVKIWAEQASHTTVAAG